MQCRTDREGIPGGVELELHDRDFGGQHADYIEAQLLAFRGGARHNNPVMAAVAATLSAREIKALADYAAGLR